MRYSGVSPSIWFEGYQPNKNARLRLFCFPPAGGSAYQYMRWERELPGSIEVFPVQLPGRGGRLNEPPFRRLMPLAQTLARDLVPFLDRPYALFGHSMGALIAFELARHLERSIDNGPALLIVSGRRGPEWPRSKPPTYDLPDEEFKAELRRMNGTPEDVLNNPQLMELMTPMLRADFELVQTYVFEGPCALRCPIRGYGGLGDSAVTTESLQAWRQYTASSFSMSLFPGDHFFVFQSHNRFFYKLAMDLTAPIAAMELNGSRPGGGVVPARF
jgi:medium-chain acyl-[acyl-carrier-protein] hydrolase